MAESLVTSQWPLPDVPATVQCGRALGAALLRAAPPPLVVYLEGELGAGKTTLVRALLAELGHQGRVPSPTYTLVEPYELRSFRVLHVDLYRLRDPSELDDLGLADELGATDPEGRGTLLLAEWPGRGAGRLPAADLTLRLRLDGAGRQAVLEAGTPAGAAVLIELARPAQT